MQNLRPIAKIIWQKTKKTKILQTQTLKGNILTIDKDRKTDKMYSRFDLLMIV